MASYTINKGVGRDVEFHGLRAQYLLLFAGGLLGVFVLFVALYMAGIGPLTCVALCLILGTGLVFITFRLNAKYGAHGLMKAAVGRYHPRRIIHRKRLARLLRRSNQKSTYEK